MNRCDLFFITALNLFPVLTASDEWWTGFQELKTRKILTGQILGNEYKKEAARKTMDNAEVSRTSLAQWKGTREASLHCRKTASCTHVFARKRTLLRLGNGASF